MKVKDNCNLKKGEGGGINIKFDPRTLQNKGLSTETMRKGQEARVCTGRFRSVFGDHLCSVQNRTNRESSNNEHHAEGQEDCLEQTMD